MRVLLIWLARISVYPFPQLHSDAVPFLLHIRAKSNPSPTKIRGKILFICLSIVIWEELDFYPAKILMITFLGDIEFICQSICGDLYVSSSWGYILQCRRNMDIKPFMTLPFKLFTVYVSLKKCILKLWFLVQDRMYWAKTEKWLQQRYTEINPTCEDNNHFRILGYQWRTLHFNDQTRQSTAKIMAGYKKSDPDSVFFMQQANCLAVPCNILPHLFLSL